MNTAGNIFFDSNFRALASTHGFFQTTKMEVEQSSAPDNQRCFFSSSALRPPPESPWAAWKRHSCVSASLGRSKLSLQWDLLISHWASFLPAIVCSPSMDSQARKDLLTESIQLLLGRVAHKKEFLARGVNYRTYSQSSHRKKFLLICVSGLVQCQEHKKSAN